jgi:AcrR family transcriptional regulator
MHDVSEESVCMLGGVPKLWTETVEAHRAAVRDAILDTTAALVTEHGPASVTMSQIAGQTGIGRATLYKYFPDVDAILIAWHQRHVAAHLDQLAALAGQPGTAGARLHAVLETYAFIAHHRGRHGADLTALVHRGEDVAQAQQQLIDLIRDLLTEVAATGELRDDVAPDELASYCLHALGAASALSSPAAVHRLVAVTLTGLRPSP